jgi:hypothetical protein
VEKFSRKIGDGEIRLPVIRIEHSQKCAKGIHLDDLANYLDHVRAGALRNLDTKN